MNIIVFLRNTIKNYFKIDVDKEEFFNKMSKMRFSQGRR